MHRRNQNYAKIHRHKIADEHLQARSRVFEDGANSELHEIHCSSNVIRAATRATTGLEGGESSDETQQVLVDGKSMVNGCNLSQTKIP